MRILHVKTPRTQRLRFLAGQRVSLEIPGIATTEKHVASCPCDDMNLQFHIDQDDNDSFSRYVFSKMKTNDVININGPSGHFILHEDSPNPIVFVAFANGFAPIKSLIEHAMTLDVTEHIHLYWLVENEQDMYMQNLCRAWSDAFERFSYAPIIYKQGEYLAPLLEKLTADIQQYDERHYYIAGPGNQATTTKNALLKQGVPQANLFTETV